MVDLEKDIKEFMDVSNKCADSLSKWIDNCEFESSVIARVFIDYFMAYCKENEISVERSIKLIVDLYNMKPKFFAIDNECKDECCPCKKEKKKNNNVMEQLHDIIDESIKKIRNLEEKL